MRVGGLREILAPRGGAHPTPVSPGEGRLREAKEAVRPERVAEPGMRVQARGLLMPAA